MAQLNQEVRHAFYVTDLAGQPVSTLTGANFTTVLKRQSGASLISTSETVTIAEIGSGWYWIYYMPTAAATLYVLTVVAVSGLHIVNAPSSGFQDQVDAAYSASSGPYLTTRDAVKAAFTIAGSTKDAQIDALLAQVTAYFQTYCGRNFFQATVTEYPTPLAQCFATLIVDRPPIASVASLYISTAIPRVYDASTLLVEGTDFLVSQDGQWIELVTPRYVYNSVQKVAKLTYLGGYAVVPPDVERAAQEIIGVKVMKSQSGGVYHFLTDSRADGQVQGFRWDDVTPNAQAVLDAYRLMAFA